MEIELYNKFKNIIESGEVVGLTIKYTCDRYRCLELETNCILRTDVSVNSMRKICSLLDIKGRSKLTPKELKMLLKPYFRKYISEIIYKDDPLLDKVKDKNILDKIYDFKREIETAEREVITNGIILIMEKYYPSTYNMRFSKLKRIEKSLNEFLKKQNGKLCDIEINPGKYKVMYKDCLGQELYLYCDIE